MNKESKIQTPKYYSEPKLNRFIDKHPEITPIKLAVAENSILQCSTPREYIPLYCLLLLPPQDKNHYTKGADELIIQANIFAARPTKFILPKSQDYKILQGHD